MGKHDSLEQPSPLAEMETMTSGGTDTVWVKAPPPSAGPIDLGPLFSAGYAAGVADGEVKYKALVRQAQFVLQHVNISLGDTETQEALHGLDIALRQLGEPPSSPPCKRCASG